MPAMNHVSVAVLLTCYDFFLLWSSNLDFLFLLPPIQSLITFRTCIFCISDLIFLSLSLFFPLSLLLPLFLRVLFLSPCVIFLGTYGPWHCHTHKFPFSVFCFCYVFLFLSPLPSKKKTLMWISKILICHLRLVNNLSYPRLPVCVVQSGSSSAVHADCALALINWVCSRRKRIVWAFEIFGRRLLCFLCLLTLVQPHTKLKKKKKKRWEKSQDIGFMMLLQGAQYLYHSQILGI